MLPQLPDGFIHLFFFSFPLPSLLLLVIVFVVRLHEGKWWVGQQRGLPQLCRGGLETMGVLGSSDAKQQLLEELVKTTQSCRP